MLCKVQYEPRGGSDSTWVGEDVREAHTGLKGMRRHVSGEESLRTNSGNKN